MGNEVMAWREVKRHREKGQEYGMRMLEKIRQIRPRDKLLENI